MNEELNEAPLYKGIFHQYGLTYSDLIQFKYGGGNGNNSNSDKRHSNYFNLVFGDNEYPDKTDRCPCGHRIKENCYIYKENSSEYQLVILGNCCIKKFIPKSSRTCKKCEMPHKNRKWNLCKNCKKEEIEIEKEKIRENERLRIIEIEKEKVRMIENIRIYLKVSYDMKDIAKSFGAKWNPDNKKWFTSKTNMYNNNLFETFEVIKQY